VFCVVFGFSTFQFLIKGYRTTLSKFSTVTMTFNSSLKDTFNFIWIAHCFINFFQFLIKGYGGYTSRTSNANVFQFLIKGYQGTYALTVSAFSPTFNSSLKDTYGHDPDPEKAQDFQFLIKGYKY